MRRIAAPDLGTVGPSDPISFDLTPYFSPNYDYLSIVGLPGTGLVLQRSGLLSGSLSATDLAKASATGSLQFTVLARNLKQQLTQQDFIIDVVPAAAGSRLPQPQTQPQPQRLPQSQPQPQPQPQLQRLPQPSSQTQLQFRSVKVDHNLSDIADACQGRLFRFAAARYFTTTNGEPLTFSISSNSANTGSFFIDPVTGDVTGIIDTATVLPSPLLELQITAQDSSNLASFKLRVNFRQPVALRTTSRPTVPPAFVGVPWAVDVGSAFAASPTPIVITWDNAPAPGTGLKLMTSEGTTWIRGIPTEADFQAQRQLSIKADDGCSTATMAIPVSINRRAPPTVLPCNTVVPPAYLRRTWFWDASACFESDTSLVFALSGLTNGTGLSIDSQTGAISGMISAADAATTDFPWGVTVTATAPSQAGGLSSNMTFFLWVKIPVNPLVLAPRKGQLPSLAWVGQSLTINYASLFQSKNTLDYSLSGLPDNSGLRFSESMGVLTGTVQRSAAGAIQPVLLTLSADDRMGGTASFNHSITFIFPNIPQWRPFVTVPIAYRGVAYSLNLYNQFQNPGQLNMVLTGLPAGSGLYWNASSGILSGSAGQADVNAAQLSLTLAVDDGQGGVGSFPFTVPVLDYQPIVEQSLPTDALLINSPFSFNLGLYFQAQLGRVLTANVTGLPSSLSFDPTTGVISGTPTRADLAAPQPFIVLVQVSDGVVQVKRTWLLTVAEPNRPPAASPILPAEATAGLYFVRDIKPFFSDADNQTLAYSLDGLPRGTGLTFDGVSGILSGVPTFADVTVGKPAALTITADDGHYKGTVQAILQLTVRPVNNPPFVSNPIPSPATSVQGRQFSGALSQHFVDPDGDVLSFSINGLPPGSGLSLDPTGTLSGFPNTQDMAASPMRISIKADDNRGGVVFGSFDLIVQPIIPPPIALPMPSLQGQEAQPIFMNVKQYFQSTVPLQYVMDGLSPQTGLQLGFDSGLLDGVPSKADVTGPNSRTVTVYVHNSQGGKAQSSFQLQIKPISRPPIASPIPNLRGTVGQAITYDMTKFFSDPDFNPLTYSISGLPKNSGLSISPLGMFSGTPLAVDGNTSPLTLTVVASDDGGMQAFSIFVLTLAKNYKAPIADPIPPSLAVMGISFQLDLKPYFHPNTARPMQYAVAGLPKDTGLSVGIQAGVLSGTPTLGDCIASNRGKSPIQLTIFANEGGGANATSTFLLTVRQSNTAPVVSVAIPPATATVGEVFVYDITTAFYDADGDDLVYGITGLPAGSGLEIDPAEGLIHGTPNAAACLWSMPLNLVINASDGMAPPVTAPFSLTILCGAIGVHFVGSIPDGLAYANKLWLLDLSPFFEYNGPYKLRFSATGFPSGSGFVVAANGIAYGQPTSQDCRTFADQKVIRIEVDDGHQNTDVGYFPFRVDCSAKSTQDASNPFAIPAGAYVNPIMTMYVGSEFSFDVAQGFVQLKGQSLKYSATGLPPGTGISFDPYGVRVYGTPNAQDCANNPLMLIITGQNGKVRRQSVVFMVFPSCDPIAPSPMRMPTIAMALNDNTGYQNLQPPAFPANSGNLQPLPAFSAANSGNMQLPPVFPAANSGSLQLPPASPTITNQNLQPLPIFPPTNIGNQNLLPASFPATNTGNQNLQPSPIFPALSTNVPLPQANPSFVPALQPPKPVGTANIAPLQNQPTTSGTPPTQQPLLTIFTNVTVSNQAKNSAQQPVFTPSQPQESSGQQVSVSVSVKQPLVPPPSNSPSNITPPKPLQASQPPPPPPPSLFPSAAKCSALGWAVPPASKNIKVCATDSVSPSSKCVPVVYSVAQSLCADLGGRLCNAEELQQDVGLGGTCGDLDTQVVWSRTPCSANGAPGVLSTGGSSKSPSKGSCVVDSQIKYATRCCADFEPGTEFQYEGTVYGVDGSGNPIATLTWSWTAYRNFEVSPQLASGKWGKAAVVPAGQPFTLSAAGGLRRVRIVPLRNSDNKSEAKQTREVTVQSPT